LSATKLLLICGIVNPVVYAGTDILAGARYPGYSFRSQAVSELFAVGAPTSGLVVPLFSLGSLFFLAFAWGVWRWAGERRSLRAMAVLFAVAAVNGLVLWNFFPMHMRGAPRTLTDTMHLILAANPSVTLSLLVAAIAFRRWFRLYSIASLIVLVALASLSFSYAPHIDAGEPTPWLGVTERIAQWTYYVWQVVLAGMLLRGDSVALPDSIAAGLTHRSRISQP